MIVILIIENFRRVGLRVSDFSPSPSTVIYSYLHLSTPKSFFRVLPLAAPLEPTPNPSPLFAPIRPYSLQKNMGHQKHQVTVQPCNNPRPILLFHSRFVIRHSIV